MVFADYYRQLVPAYSWYLHSLLRGGISVGGGGGHGGVGQARHAQTPGVTSDQYSDDAINVDDDTSGSYDVMSRASDDKLEAAMLCGATGGAERPRTAFQEGVTVSYTHDAFFVSDGRSRRKRLYTPADNKSRYACSECGKHYATSSNLSRHKQTHRSPDSEQAKSCPSCGKVSKYTYMQASRVMTAKMRTDCREAD